MTEPIVEIPARVALLACKHLHHLGEIYKNHGLQSLSTELENAVIEQLCKQEIDTALVSAKIQMANDYKELNG